MKTISRIAVLAIYLAAIVIVAAISSFWVTVFAAVSYGYMLVVILSKEGVWNLSKMITTATKWGLLIAIASAIFGAIPAYLIGMGYTFYFSHHAS